MRDIKTQKRFAQDLRKNATREENHLWYDFLRTYSIQFNRQKPFGSYIVDFYCDRAKLVVELDGGQHYEEQGAAYDLNRTQELEQKYGLQVLRFSNLDVNHNFEGVCTAIDAAVQERIPSSAALRAPASPRGSPKKPSLGGRCLPEGQTDEGQNKDPLSAPQYSALFPKGSQKEISMKTVTLYTDGACSGNPGPGGWGAILMYGGRKKELSGGERSTTNNRMELTAVIQGLQALKEPCIVELYSDSKYVIDALEKGWARSWRAKGWIKGDKKPALNPDLWGALLDLCDRHTVNLHWVKGHATNPYNNRCDELAVSEWMRLKL